MWMLKNRKLSEQSVRERIFCAIDTPDINKAMEWANALNGHVGGLKIGKEFFTEYGSQGLKRMLELGSPIFLDLKFHDIPNTVAGAVRAAVRMKPKMLNVHASGGRRMMEDALTAAKEESEKLGIDRPLLIAVTLLTSQDASDLADIGVDRSVDEHVVELAKLTKSCGLDGVVCSGREIEIIKDACGPDFLTIVPGMRPPEFPGDQKRVMSPSDAFNKGADYLVIGRPITNATNVADAADYIVSQIMGEEPAVTAGDLWGSVYAEA